MSRSFDATFKGTVSHALLTPLLIVETVEVFSILFNLNLKFQGPTNNWHQEDLDDRVYLSQVHGMFPLADCVGCLEIIPEARS